MTVNVAVFDVSLGVGLTTLTWALPALATSAAGIVTIIWVGVVELGVKEDVFQLTVEPVPKPVPLIAKVNELEPAVTLEGDSDAISGLGFTVRFSEFVVSEPPLALPVKLIATIDASDVNLPLAISPAGTEICTLHVVLDEQEISFGLVTAIVSIDPKFTLSEPVVIEVLGTVNAAVSENDPLSDNTVVGVMDVNANGVGVGVGVGVGAGVGVGVGVGVEVGVGVAVPVGVLVGVEVSLDSEGKERDEQLHKDCPMIMARTTSTMRRVMCSIPRLS